MEKAVISILGPDRPGIIAAATRILFDDGCNIENVSQTTLQTEFSGIFIVSIPEELTIEALNRHLESALGPLDQHVYVKPLLPGTTSFNTADCERFVIATRGPDQKGLVARITEVISRHGVNVTNLQAIFKGGDKPVDNVMIYEVDVPPDADQSALYSDLRQRAADLGLTISIQHRRIFEAINRV